MNPDQTAPLGAVRSGSILFAIWSTEELKQMREQATKVVTGGEKALTNHYVVSLYKTLYPLLSTGSTQKDRKSSRHGQKITDWDVKHATKRIKHQNWREKS